MHTSANNNEVCTDQKNNEVCKHYKTLVLNLEQALKWPPISLRNNPQNGQGMGYNTTQTNQLVVGQSGCIGSEHRIAPVTLLKKSDALLHGLAVVDYWKYIYLVVCPVPHLKIPMHYQEDWILS
jgi:hypothetical protein